MSERRLPEQLARPVEIVTNTKDADEFRTAVKSLLANSELLREFADELADKLAVLLVQEVPEGTGGPLLVLAASLVEHGCRSAELYAVGMLIPALCPPAHLDNREAICLQALFGLMRMRGQLSRDSTALLVDKVHQLAADPELADLTQKAVCVLAAIGGPGAQDALDGYRNRFPEVLQAAGESHGRLTGRLTGEEIAKTASEKKQGESSPAVAKERSSGCFIATAVFQSPMAPQVIILRRFRDLYVEPYSLGRACLLGYYAIAPALSRRIQRHQGARRILYKLLSGMASIVARTRRLRSGDV